MTETMQLIAEAERQMEQMSKRGVSNELAIELVKLVLKTASQKYNNFIVDEWWAAIIQGLYDKYIPKIEIVDINCTNSLDYRLGLHDIIINANGTELKGLHKIRYKDMAGMMMLGTARSIDNVFTYEEVSGIRVVSLESIAIGLADCIVAGSIDDRDECFDMQVEMFSKSIDKLKSRLNINKWIYTLNTTDASNVTFALKTIHNKEMRRE